jgi:outer membrane protein assembly factor BamB
VFRSRAARRLVLIGAFCVAALDLLAGATLAAGPTIALSPKAGPPTSRVSVSGTGFGAAESIEVRFNGAAVGSGTTDQAGTFSAAFQVPAAAVPGTYKLKVVGTSSGLGVEATFLVRTNWAQLRFSPAHSGFNPYENILDTSNVSRLALKWSVKPGGRMVASPVIANGRLYVTSQDGTLSALDPATGTTFWRVSVGAPTYSPAAVARGRVYVSSDVGRVSAFNASTGASLWTVGTGAADPSPVTVADGRIYVAAGSNAYALDVATGATLWRTPLANDSGWGAPAVAGGRVHLHARGRALQTLDAATGAFAWSARVAESSSADSAPAVVNGIVYIVGSGAQCILSAFKASTGGLVWSVDASAEVDPEGDCDFDANDGPSPAVANGVVYSGGWGTSAFDTRTGARRWYVPGSRVSSPVVANGVLYESADSGLRALDAATGATLWSAIPAVSVMRSHVVVVDGRVYFTAQPDGLWDSIVHAFSIEGR